MRRALRSPLMYGGHFGFALAGTAREGLRPAVLVPAAFAPDLVRIACYLSGAPRYGIDSVAFIVGLAVLVGLVGGWWTGDRLAGVVLGLVAASHAAGDLLEQSLPLWPGGPVTGMRLVDLPVANHLLQYAVIVGGWLVYRRALSGPPGGATPRAVRLALGLVLAAHTASILLRGYLSV